MPCRELRADHRGDHRADDRADDSIALVPPLNVVVDAGVDDAVALAVLVGAGVDISQVIATEGSVDLETTASATTRFLASLGAPDVPVHLGARSGITQPYPGGRDPFHGEDAFGGFSAELIDAPIAARECSGIEGPVFASAALTVIAEALRRGDRPSFLLWMGGAVACGGNTTAAAEFNAWMDPAAADEVFTSGMSVSMVPLDVTVPCEWHRSDIDALGQLGTAGRLLSKPVRIMCDRDGGFVPHDAVTAVALLQPTLFQWCWRYVRCESEGTFSRGATIVDRRPQSPVANVLVAEACEREAVRAAIFDAIRALG